MQVKETIVAGVVATSVMTAFSYAVSALEKENFKEPLLLSFFLQRLTAVQHPLMLYSGWPVHYTLGLLWSSGYTFLFKRFHNKESLIHALAFGLFSGTAGVIIWKEMFRRIPHAPKTAYGKFYRQLFVAHLLFTFTLDKTYAALSDER